MPQPPEDSPPQVAILGADAAACAALAHSLSQHRPHARVALLATRLPAATHPLVLLCADERAARPAPAELRLRAALAQAGTRYQVLYGPPPARLRSALQAIDLLAASALPTGARAIFDTQESHWACAHCGDPDCERRLFRHLFSHLLNRPRSLD